MTDNETMNTVNEPVCNETAFTGEESNVIWAVLKLSRALRRNAASAPREMPFPPAVMRTLHVIEKKGGSTAGELCEALDVRPSSLSEMLSRMEANGLITRTPDEADRRQTRVSLTEAAAGILRTRREARQAAEKELTACFTEDEAKTFCELSRKLSEHLESLGGAEFPRRHGCHKGPHGVDGCCRGPRSPHGGAGCRRGPHAPHFPRHPRFF